MLVNQILQMSSLVRGLRHVQQSLCMETLPGVGLGVVAIDHGLEGEFLRRVSQRLYSILLAEARDALPPRPGRSIGSSRMHHGEVCRGTLRDKVEVLIRDAVEFWHTVSPCTLFPDIEILQILSFEGVFAGVAFVL